MAITLGPRADAPQGEIEYPESDGLPMADNTKQFEWIATLQGNLADLYRDEPDVFVAGDLLWYPVEGDNRLRAAPDAMVVFGRPKGHRGSYIQFREDGVAPQVVFEILSPSNRFGEMGRKFDFYDRFGVEEYYIYDPDRLDFSGWRRADDGDRLRFVETEGEWVSPRLGVRFVIEEEKELRLFRPDGRPFATFLEIQQARREAEARADAESERADAESERADAESERADTESARADAEAARAERLAARLRELGANPDEA